MIPNPRTRLRVAWLAPFVSVALSVPTLAQQGVGARDRALTRLEDVRAACRAADDEGLHDRLYSILIDGRAALRRRPGREEGEVRYVLADVRSLRAFDGAVQLIPSRLEPLALRASEEQARSIDVALAGGARLRVGFFLGFDEPDRPACIVRAPQAVSVVRLDLAFVELLDAAGAVVARDDDDRLRAWSDDPVHGAALSPEVSVGAASLEGGAPAPSGWLELLRGAPLRRALLACHEEGLARGAAREAMVQVIVRLDARSGQVSERVIEAGNVGDEAENACLLEALSALRFPAASGLSGTVSLRVPIRLRAP